MIWPKQGRHLGVGGCWRGLRTPHGFTILVFCL